MKFLVVERNEMGNSFKIEWKYIFIRLEIRENEE